MTGGSSGLPSPLLLLRSLLDLFKLRPSKESKEFGDLAMFMAQVTLDLLGGVSRVMQSEPAGPPSSAPPSCTTGGQVLPRRDQRLRLPDHGVAGHALRDPGQRTEEDACAGGSEVRKKVMRFLLIALILFHVLTGLDPDAEPVAAGRDVRDASVLPPLPMSRQAAPASAVQAHCVGWVMSGYVSSSSFPRSLLTSPTSPAQTSRTPTSTIAMIISTGLKISPSRAERRQTGPCPQGGKGWSFQQQRLHPATSLDSPSFLLPFHQAAAELHVRHHRGRQRGRGKEELGGVEGGRGD